MATDLSVLTSMYYNRFTPKCEISKYIDEVESVFAQLELMVKYTKIFESHKAPLLFIQFCKFISAGKHSCCPWLSQY